MNQPSMKINWMIAAAIVVWLLYLLAPVLTPFIAAALLAYIGDPLADRLQKFRLPRTLAVIAVFLLTFLMIGLLVVLVLPLIKMQVGALIDALPGLIEQLEKNWLPKLGTLVGQINGEDEIGLAAFLSQYGEKAGSWGGKVLLGLGKSGGALFIAVMSLFLVPILTFYLLRDWDDIVAHFGALVPARQRETVFRLARETDDVLGAFLRGQLLVMFALAVIYSVGLSLIGLKFAIAIGVVAGLVSFVPYLGFIFGIALAFLTVVTSPDILWMMGGIVIVFSVAQMIEGSVLTPTLVGDKIGLHPVIVIFAITAGGQLFGFFGILLALPAAAALSVLVRFAYQNYLADKPDMANPEV